MQGGLFINNSNELKKAFRERSLNCKNDNEFSNLMNMFQGIQSNNTNCNEFSAPSIAFGIDLQGLDMPDFGSMMNMINKNPNLKKRCKEEFIEMEKSGIKDIFNSMAKMMGGNIEDEYSNLKKGLFNDDDVSKIEEIHDEIKSVEFKLKITMEQFYSGFKLYDIEDFENMTNLKMQIENHNVEPGQLNIEDKNGCYKINFEILPHDYFEYKDNKLYYNLSISLKDSLCGFDLKINHLNGKEYLIKNYNRIIKPHTEICLPNLGLNNNILTIKFYIVFPDILSDDTIKKLELLFDESKISS